MFGSLASVIIHRLHTQEKGILFGRSKCPKCAHKLATIDLIPLVSYISTKFKCRYCKEPIALIYPFLELFMGIGFFVTAVLTGISNIPLLIFNLFIAFIFIVLSFYDILFREVPDEVVIPAFVIVILFNSLSSVFLFVDIIVGVTIPVIFFGALFFLSRGKWLGGGDVRIGALMGALLAWPNILIGLFLGYVFGAIFSVFGLITKKLSRKSQIPFAPFLLLGTYIAMFWGQEILNWYLSI